MKKKQEVPLNKLSRKDRERLGRKLDEVLNKNTGELIPLARLNEVILVETKRADGSIRLQQDFQNCPTMAEQHTAHTTDLNYLMDKHQPDEVAAYIAARSSYRTEILGHDFSQEPSMQEALNFVYRSKQEFESLDPDIRKHFLNHVEFLKFIDNPANAEKMIKMGILTPKQLDKLTDQQTTTNQTTTNNDQQSSSKTGEKS